MAREVERKFLVEGEYKSLATSVTRIVQGYIVRDAARTVRVRIYRQRGFLTIKGRSSADGLERCEYEYEIPVAEAEELVRLCLPGVVEKRRYRVPWGNHTFEVDEFLGANAPLVVAEVELNERDEAFSRPPFLGKEVTGDPRYYNSYLSQSPYSLW